MVVGLGWWVLKLRFEFAVRWLEVKIGAAGCINTFRSWTCRYLLLTRFRHVTLRWVIASVGAQRCLGCFTDFLWSAPPPYLALGPQLL